MKKRNLLLLVCMVLLFGACESEKDNEVFQQITAENGQTQMKGLPLSNGQTKANNNTFKANWGVGEKIGVYMQANNTLEGPIPFTISSISNGVINFEEPINFIDPESLHTFYAYHPYEANVSVNPEAVNVPPVKSIQEQIGNTSEHLGDYQFNIAIPANIFPDQEMYLQFTSTHSFFDFQISSNVNGLVIKNIRVEAPQGEALNFTEATTNITLSLNDPNFAKYSNLKGATSETLLNIKGGLSIPGTSNDYASAYMVINPFNGNNKTLKVTVTTDDDQVYTFEIDGQNYRFGSTYIIPLHIQKDKPQPVIKDIRVLSLYSVGCLGTKDNTKKWDCYYGATDFHAKEIRRLLFEHFGKGKTVETGVISFEKTDINCYLNKLTESYLDQFNIIYLNRNARPNAQTTQRIMNWLNKSQDRVLMLSYDWKEACVIPTMKESTIITKIATNYLIFRDQINEVKPHWYNGNNNQAIGNWGASRSGILLPFELNERTSYFWKDGPFKTDLTETSDQRFWISESYWGCAEVNDPNIIPLITYRDARDDSYPNKQHKYGYGDEGMILGVNPASRIVYIGDSKIFSTVGVGKKVEDARMSKEDICQKTGELNNYSKIMGNLWAWMIQEVIQKN